MRKMLSFLLLMLATMTSWTSVYAQTDEEYDAAMNAIDDGAAYQISTTVDATKYYITKNGTLTTNVAEAGIFAVTKTTGGAFKDVGIQISSGSLRFTNAALQDDHAVLACSNFSVTTDARATWEVQVPFLKDGKYAIRATNAEYAESSWGDAGRVFFTYAIAEAVVVPQYSYDPAYIWDFELQFDAAGVAARQEAYNTVQNWLTKIQTASGLVKDDTQYISNAKDPSEGSYAALLDQDYATFFHSTWHSENDPQADHYLQAELKDAVQKFQFYYKKRSQNSNNRPTTIVISASNDGENFTEIQTINEGLPTSDAVIDYLSDVIDLGAAYKYVRFTIPETNNGQKTGDHVFFTFSEFYMLPNDATFESALTYWKQGTPALQLTSNDIETINQIENDLENALVDVTYRVMFNGAVVGTATAQAMPDTKPSMPESLKRGFVTFSDPDVSVITRTDNVVTYTATWTGPFEISTDFATAHWYDMAMRGTWYVTSAAKDSTDGDAYVTQNANTMGLVEESYHWAFMGNPWEGFKILNKAEGEGKSFGVTDDQKTNAGIPTVMDDAEGSHEWKIVPSTNTGVPAGSFCLNVPGTNLYINQYGGAGGKVKFWDSTNNIGDPGSAFTIMEVPTNFGEFVTAEIAPYFESTAKYFVFTDAAKASVGYDPAYKTECPFETYKSLKEKMSAEFMADVTNYVLPETGYYILQNKMYGTYLGIDPSDANLYGNYQTATAAKQIVKLTKVGDKTYNIGLMGKFAPATVGQSQQVTATVDAGTYTVVVSTVGYGAFMADPEATYSALHCASQGNIVGWEPSAAAEASQWAAENATSIQVTIGEEGYATAYLPFPAECAGNFVLEIPEPLGTWTFDNPENPLAGTGVATLTAANQGSNSIEAKADIAAAGITTIDGGLNVPKGSSLIMNANNGATSMGTYTVLYDVCADDASTFIPLLQNDMNNAKNAGLFFNRNKIGIGGGFGFVGNFNNGEWYRILFVVEPTGATIYVNGEQIAKKLDVASNYNTSWVLSTGAVFFADNDGQEKDIKVSELRFWDVALTAEQAEALGAAGYSPESSSLKAYIATVDGNGYSKWLNMTEVEGVIPEATPVILKAAPETYVINIVSDGEVDGDGLKIHKDTAVDGSEALAKEAVDLLEENVLKGTFESIDAAGKYVLAKPENEVIGFYKAASGKIAGGKAYLELDADVKALYFKFDDDATGIQTFTPAIAEGEAIYNIAGQRLSKMQKGINIVNGKKILK